jgi:hypothetical protein
LAETQGREEGARGVINRQIIRDHRAGQPSKVARDIEVRELVDDLLPHLTFTEIEAECRKRFSSERSPSRSAIHRYWLRYHKGKGTAVETGIQEKMK